MFPRLLRQNKLMTSVFSGIKSLLKELARFRSYSGSPKISQCLKLHVIYDVSWAWLRGAQPLTWTPELDTAFSKCKEALSEVTLLTHPATDVPLGLLRMFLLATLGRH
ncbi:hypothetical protein TNIN_170121 [Trichonephila inaurata madagascariensis]|uniref:Uncharacterized protein n=1 Tax=Trichonephila inaurata madagascariensis TaxID=2747483 RepID=A0A8X6X8B5_9ARAC|nr:hypothetical protein TNIN_170121 [Trichonephila inaurata madagascariensis]